MDILTIPRNNEPKYITPARRRLIVPTGLQYSPTGPQYSPPRPLHSPTAPQYSPPRPLHSELYTQNRNNLQDELTKLHECNVVSYKDKIYQVEMNSRNLEELTHQLKSEQTNNLNQFNQIQIAENNLKKILYDINQAQSDHKKWYWRPKDYNRSIALNNIDKYLYQTTTSSTALQSKYNVLVARKNTSDLKIKDIETGIILQKKKCQELDGQLQSLPNQYDLIEMKVINQINWADGIISLCKHLESGTFIR